ncbi:pentapeptide repeat-containing protein [Nodularia harveyana UHCC-0300]|uniref:Pentapeptide repeat-containing protein n=1 Tax=Nodularia harveyana UHCC-0300 TaxID=2974287 RepID=A0ABU5UH58_9CYAN|nr:pentapeptide repeat-containing protein [Nodularia harveyana]MEA5582892.1 pentapeptide repeat-containing protein [Nodularia harveyana UHCC-0300]
MFKDFSGQNLCGKSFKGEDLSGANFQGADLRGASFTKAILKEANFSYTNSGLQSIKIFYLVVFSLLLVALAGIIAGLGGIFAFYFTLHPKTTDIAIISNTFILFSLSIFIGITFWKDFLYGLLLGLLVLVPSLLIALALIGHITAISQAFFVGIGALSSIATSLAAIALAQTVIIMILNSVPIAIFGSFILAIVSAANLPTIESTTTTAIISVLGSYIAWQASKGAEKFTWIQKIAVAAAATGGTSFRGADLTDANFTQAKLKSTDFRGAILIRTCFHQVKMLDRVRLGTTYLQNAQARQVLVTGQGQEKNFDRDDLRGVNFQGANLVDASFIGADLSEANLQDADLSRAKLVQTQLNGTDLTGATLTGVYIQDWGITTDTKFDGVRCEYVYMRLPTKEKPDPLRKPDNHKEVFADGEFGDFIKPIFDTLDLYHNQDVDPRAIAISFKQLAENHPDADLRIVGMEVRGEDKFLLRAKTAATSDKSELSSEYFATYNKIKGLPERKIKLLLEEKDSRIRSLENMVNTALQTPKFYAENYNNQGDTMPQGSKKESNFNLQNAQFGGGLVNADTVNAEQIGGDITNYGQQQQQKEAQTETHNSAVKIILILASNPQNTTPLRLDEEVREIDAGLQRAKKRELFDLKQRWAVRVQDVYQALLDFKPQIVHFSGHGSEDDGLALENKAGNLKLVDTEALAKLFELFSTTIECIVLNACYSEVQASAIAKYIPYVIGMNQAIGDKAAVKFATGFYNALGAGESVEFAYKLGCNVIQLDGIPEHLTPVLIKKQ